MAQQKFDTTTEPLVIVDGAGGHQPLVAPASGKAWQRAQVKLATSNGDTVWIAAGTNKLKIRSLFLLSDVAQTITIKNHGGTELLGPLYLVANQGFSLNPPANNDEYWTVGASATGLDIKSTAAANLGGGVTYIDEP